MTLTKAQIADTIQKQLKLSGTESYELMEDLLEIIKQTLASGEDIMISGFGKFCVKEKKVRRGRNPATGEDLMLDARRVIIFRCSGELRDKINRE
ncbi:MAG: integration host factor subunit alpha [Deltaproteobacteria bacterium]|nr:integration host factor subunit alpha [Deltaproteobacteria bacterium]